MTMTLEVDSKTRVAEVLKKVTTIATLPQVTSQIIKIVEDPKSTAQQLNKVVSHDPALVTRILKVVNSAFYGLPGQIGSIERAIVILGLNGVKNTAVAASLGQLFRGAELCQGFTAKDLWTHCTAVAVVARDLARNMKLNLSDEAFLAGLIHDIGLLVQLQLYPEKLREVCDAARADGSDFCELERKLIGLDHQQLGMGLTEQWKFPRACQLVAGYHHQPLALADPSRHLVSIVHVADTLCCQSSHGFNLTGLHQSIPDERLAELRVDPMAVAHTRSRLDQLVSEVAVLMG
ncbi:MAG TPA: HDOD domain-containing protein [Tepidisphaeraceae bacterium]|nr:HDOD domain-containing protein [Tepidisphaeraceae bacterium]